MSTRSIHQWLEEYGESHRNATNKAIHWVCVPVIYFCIIGLLYSIPLPGVNGWFSEGLAARIALAFVALFYLRLSVPLMVGMVLFTLLCIQLAVLMDQHVPLPLWQLCLALFALAWIGQFFGHHVEGRKPSFLKDVEFLMIGPAWLMSFIFRRLGIRY
jgi:uncharacterized membrane protein YGL010W